MENKVDVLEELKNKNQELLLNKKIIDLDTSMDSILVFYENYSVNLISEVNKYICSIKNIDLDSEQSIIMLNTISSFFNMLKDKLKELITFNTKKIKKNIKDISDMDYSKELQYMSIEIINHFFEYYGNNINMLIDELVRDLDEVKVSRVNNYFLEIIYNKIMNTLQDKFMYSIKVIDNNYEENYQVIQSINEKTLKSV